MKNPKKPMDRQPPRPPKAESQVSRKLKITPEQTTGIKVRQAALDTAQMELATFLSAVVAGHGIDKANVTNLEDEKHELTVTVVP